MNDFDDLDVDVEGETDPFDAKEESNILKLSKPFTYHKEEVRKLIFSEATSRHLIRCGDPHNLTVGEDGDMEFVSINMRVIARYIVALARTEAGGSVTAGMVERLSPKDFRRAQNIILGFFSEEDGGRGKS